MWSIKPRRQTERQTWALRQLSLVICRLLTDWGIQYRWHLNYSATGGATIIAYSPSASNKQRVLFILDVVCSYSHFCSLGTFYCLFGWRWKHSNYVFLCSLVFLNTLFKTPWPPPIPLCQRMLESGLLKRSWTPNIHNTAPNRNKTNINVCCKLSVFM